MENVKIDWKVIKIERKENRIENVFFTYKVDFITSYINHKRDVKVIYNQNYLKYGKMPITTSYYQPRVPCLKTMKTMSQYELGHIVLWIWKTASFNVRRPNNNDCWEEIC